MDTLAISKKKQHRKRSKGLGAKRRKVDYDSTRRLHVRDAEVNSDEECDCADEEILFHVHRSTVLTMPCDTAPARFQKGCFPVSDIQTLAGLLTADEELWQFRKDTKRGPKNFFITGCWTATGHFRQFLDKTYHTGKAGKFFASGKHEVQGIENPSPLLVQLSVIANKYFKLFKPKLYEAISKLAPEYKQLFEFGCFHMFMAIEGDSLMHTDDKDALSFLLPIQLEERAGGQFEIGGTRTCFDWKPGDGLIIDSRQYTHGSREYEGEAKRIIGLFIVHLEFLRFVGIDPSTVL